jgi:para-aminobenzoate synthetase/4-amino-4-deoxychorismate lyase
MSIAIRTILLGQPENGMRPAELGVGGGIVADSKPAVEFEETRLKARFITGLDPGFGLFETMRASRLRGIRDLDAHLNRLVSSACKFGFTYDLVAIRQLLLQAVNKLEPGLIFRLRLDLAHDGSMALTVDELLPTLEIPALYVISEHPLPENERALVGHKTTFRRTYDTAIRYAESVGAFDALFFNDRGELTEGARTNVFVRSNGYWWTPPLECGLLPGILRARLLNHTTQVQERVIRRGDLIRAEAVILCNGLRGIIRAIPAKCLPICARTAFQTDLAPPRCRYSSQALRSRRQ